MLCMLKYKHNRQWEHRPNGLLQQRYAKGNAGPKVFINIVLYQMERWPNCSALNFMIQNIMS
jgi:hypothetical protein